MQPVCVTLLFVTEFTLSYLAFYVFIKQLSQGCTAMLMTISFNLQNRNLTEIPVKVKSKG